LVLVQLSQIKNIFRFDECLRFTPEDFAFCMETDQKFGKPFLQKIEANKISIVEKIQFNSKFLITA
jgi:hypothetical protein